jgi:hypothetical protein
LIATLNGDGASLVPPRSGRLRLFAAWSVLFRAGDQLYELKVRVMTARRFDRRYQDEAQDPRWVVLRRGGLVVMLRLDG